MKKILVCLLTVLLLAGCSSTSVAKISDEDTVIWKSDNKTYTSKDLYNDMKTQDYTTVIMNDIVSKIAEKENIDYSSTLEEIELTYQSFIDMGYGTYLEYYYGTKENYVNEMLSEGIYRLLLEKEADNRFNEFVEEYAPYKAQIAFFETKEAAQAVIDAVQANENTFAYAASENGYTGTVEDTIYTDDIDLPVEVKEVAAKMSASGLSSIVTTSVSSTDADGNSTVTPRYYIINMVENDVNEFKDEFITVIAENYLDRTEVINGLIKKYNVKVYDQDVYETLVQTYDAIGY